MNPRTTRTVLIATATAAVSAALVTGCSSSQQTAAGATTTAAPTTTQDPRTATLMEALNTANSPTLRGMTETTAVDTAGYICQIIGTQAYPLGSSHNEQKLNLLQQVQAGKIAMSPTDVDTFVDLVNANYCR